MIKKWLTSVLCFIFILSLILVFAGCTKPAEKKIIWPEKIRVILDNTSVLKYDKGGRLPLYLWPAIDPGILSDDMAEKLITEMDKRGIGIVCSWSMDDTAKVFSKCLPVARAQKKLDQRININASDLLNSFFNGDEATARVDKNGKPFFDDSFGEHKMGCPFTLDLRKEEIKKRVELFVNRYKKEGLPVDFIFTDWEIDGPLEVNRAFEASKRCERCCKYLGKDFTFQEFQKKMREMRAYLQSYSYSGPVLSQFPHALVGNYADYPDDGYRYWYDYFEHYVSYQPCREEQNAKYRKWYNDFPLTGFTFAMPVVYPWSGIYKWYDFDNSDYRWFYNMLMNAGSAGKSTPASIPLISFVHWHTIFEGSSPDSTVKQLGREAYQELLWHMLLRGTDAFFLWCMDNENPEEVKLLQEVYAEAQQYGKFLDHGIPVTFDLPEKPGSVISGLILEDSILLRRTDFDNNRDNVQIIAGTRKIDVPYAPGKCCVISIASPVSERSQKPEIAGLNNQNTVQKNYSPLYWVEGVGERGRGISTDSAATAILESVYVKGWRGITFWGADRDGAKMNYFFNSPFLEKQKWASFKGDRLAPYVTAAHKKGVKVMINMEGVNPYHWELNKWTPDNIGAVAADLASDGVDAVFEECFEVKPEVFISLAKHLKNKGVNYISGTDPMLLRESNFAALWPETGTIDIYNYYLKRDKIFNIATLTQNGSLGYGWAKYWGKPTSMISPVNRNWGIAADYSPAVIPYLCMIRALQFRLDNFIIFGGFNTFDPVSTQAWIKKYVDKQEDSRPVLDIVVLLKKKNEYSASETGDPCWNRLFNSGDAITSGGMNAGYNIIVSDKVIPADAYWIYASGGDTDNLPSDVVELFRGDKPVFIQCGRKIPGGRSITPSWKTVLDKCGIDGTKTFGYGGDNEIQSGVSVPPDQEEEIPYTGYYKDVYLRFTGSDIQRGMDLRAGTVIPKEAIRGTVFCAPNKTYGKGPFITGKGNKYVVTSTTLNWEAAYPVSDLLSGSGVMPSSNVWGIAGKNVTALLAIETTELEIKIPGLQDGSKIHVVVWDNKKTKRSEETVVYKAPFKKILKEYDLILIDRLD